MPICQIKISGLKLKDISEQTLSKNGQSFIPLFIQTLNFGIKKDLKN